MNKTIKLIEPAEKPDKNCPIYTSVAFVASIFANHANYFKAKIKVNKVTTKLKNSDYEDR